MGFLPSNKQERWRLGFHMMLPGGIGSLNDPNGCCQFKGVYHLFHQYQPRFPEVYPRAWGHAWSYDLAYWASQITTTTRDGVHFSAKRVLLLPQDYPEYASCHVRDPKVWAQDDGGPNRFHMLLGVRDKQDSGFIMIYDSGDKLHWTWRFTLRSKARFGYMWECPDLIRIQDRAGNLHEFLAFCPQRSAEELGQEQGRSFAGYIPLSSRVLDIAAVDTSKFTF